jgi:rhamnogalacturonyl hydrolase YesR
MSIPCLTRCLVAAILLFCAATVPAASNKLPSRSEVLAVTRLAAKYAQQRYPTTVEAYWDDGVYHIGMMALYDATQDIDVLRYTERFGEFNDWTLDRGVMAANGHNRLASAQSWISAYGDSSIADLVDVRAEIESQTSRSLADVTSSAYFAVDSQFMALPAFAMLGKLDSNSSYFNRLNALFNYNKTTLGLYDSAAHLYYRDASYIYPAKQTPSGKKVFWSRGNGWAIAALARILRELPPTDPARAEYVTTFKEMSAALKAVQRPDGFWNMSLYDPDHFAGPETSGTALFVYGIAWGIDNGLLARSTYRPVVARGWNAMVTTALHPDGKLGYIQGVQQQPVSPTKVTYESTSNFGVGVFLLAGSEVMKLTVDGTKYEAENLSATVSPGDSQQLEGDAAASGESYSRGTFDAVNDSIRYSASVPAPGTYNVKVRFAKAPDLGRWQFYTGGVNVGARQDAYGNAFAFSEVDLGNVSYGTSGKKVFRFTVTGKNSASTGFATAIDYVMLTKQ